MKDGEGTRILSAPVTITINSTALPVELTELAGTVLDKSILLNWRTLSEVNNEQFNIEESQDGRTFQKIGEVRSVGTSMGSQDYSFNVFDPRSGTSFYRLKQIDFDGQFIYSNVISLDFEREDFEVGQFYPNPSKSGIVNLEYSTQEEGSLTILVFDLTGKLVTERFKVVSVGSNNLIFDFSSLRTGAYIVKIGEQHAPLQRKLVIKR